MDGVFGLPIGPPPLGFAGVADTTSCVSRGPVVFGGSNIYLPNVPAPVSFGLSGNTMTARAVLPDFGTTATNTRGVAALGASNTGNTAGNTGTSAGTWVIAGTNNVTVSESTAAGAP